MQHLHTSSEKNKKNPKISIGKAFKTIIWPKRRLVFIGLVLIVVSRLASLVAPLKIKSLLDDVIPNKDYDELYNLIIYCWGSYFNTSSNIFFINTYFKCTSSVFNF